MTAETELAFVARLRDEASHAARDLRGTLDSLAGTTKAVSVPVVVRDEATAAIATVDEQLAGIGPTATAAASEARAATATIGRTFVDTAGRIRNADGTFARAGAGVGTATAAGFSRTSEAGARRAGSRFSGIFAKESLGPLRAYGEAAAGFLALDKITEFVRGSVEAARQLQKQQRLAEQVIKTTGGAAGVTADDVTRMSESMSKATGVEAVQIENGARMLLTFRAVHNELGRGNDIYTRAVGLANDLSVSMGESEQSAAIQLGKALNDPTRGLTMLNRVGIQFTAGQTARIQGYQQEGKLLDAQKIILAEVGKEFGGSARAAATSGTKIKAAFQGLREQFGTALFGAIGKVENAVAGRLVPMLEAVPGVVRRIVDDAKAFGTAVAPGVMNIVRAVRDLIVAGRNVVVALHPLEVVTLAALIGEFRAAWAITATLAAAIRSLTGFFANSKAAGIALSIVLGTVLVRQALAFAASLAKSIALNFDGFLLGLVLKFGQVRTAMAGATGGVGKLSAGMGALGINPVVLGLTAMAAVAAYAWNKDAEATRRAQQAAQDYVSSLGATKTSLQSVQQAIGRLSETDILSTAAASGGGGQQQIQEIFALGKARDQLVAQAAQIRSTEASVSRSMGTSTGAVERLATAYKIDLTGPLPEVRKALDAAAAATARTHRPTAQARADLSTLGDKASTATNDVQTLTNALNLLAGDTLSARQGVTAFYGDIATLDKALHAAKGNFSLTSKAGRDYRDALDSAAQQTLNNAEAEAKLKNGASRARAELSSEIAVLKAHAGGSGVAQHAVGLLEHALANIPSTGQAAGKGLDSSSKTIVGAARRSASAAQGALHDGQTGARNAGHEFGTGYAAGIIGTIATVIAATVKLVNDAIAAARSKKGQDSGSPSRKMTEVGHEAGDGVAKGIRERIPHVSAASVKLVNSVVSAFRGERSSLRQAVDAIPGEIRTAFGSGEAATRKALDGIRHTVKGRFEAIRGSLRSEAKSLAGHISTLRRQVADTKDAAARKRYAKELATAEKQRAAVLSERARIDAQESRAIDGIRQRTGKLERLAARRQTVAARLDRAEARLSSLRQARAGLRQSIRSGISSFADVTGITVPNDAPVTAGFIAQGLQQRLAQVKAYARNIRTLIRRHVNRGIIREIIAEGPEQGGAYAAALASATDAQLATINQAQGKIDDTSKSLAKFAGSAFYDAGVKAARGLVDGLKKREKDLDDAGRALGRRIARAIKHELGIHSPSRVLRDEVGAMIPTGTAEGITRHAYIAEAAAAKMAARVAKASSVELAPVTSALADLADRPVTITRAATSTVEIRHRVSFDQPAVAAKLSAADVADVIARDPRSAERLERVLAPQRGRISAGIHRASG